MRYVAFDIGEVLTTINFEPFFESYRHYGLDQLEDPMVFLEDLHGQQDVGLTTIERASRERFGVSKEVAKDLLHYWNKVVEPDDDMMAFLDDLKKEGVNVALLSNMGNVHAQLFRNEFWHIFDKCTLHLSCEVGARKPTKLFYQSFLMDHPEFRGCVYLDDRVENIATGFKYDFQSIRFELYEFKKLPVEERAGILRNITEKIMK